MARLCERWVVRPFFRAAYRAGGNGIVERNHRTVKAMAERGKGDPIEAVYWYNNAPRDHQREESVTRASILKTRGREPAESRDRVGEQLQTTVKVGDEVKPPNPRCTSEWGSNKGVFNQ